MGRIHVSFTWEPYFGIRQGHRVEELCSGTGQKGLTEELGMGTRQLSSTGKLRRTLQRTGLENRVGEQDGGVGQGA